MPGMRQLLVAHGACASAACGCRWYLLQLPPNACMPAGYGTLLVRATAMPPDSAQPHADCRLRRRRSTDSAARLWDARSGSPASVLVPHAGPQPIPAAARAHAVAWAPRGGLVALATDDEYFSPLICDAATGCASSPTPQEVVCSRATACPRPLQWYW
jgi:hypothetical protein